MRKTLALLIALTLPLLLLISCGKNQPDKDTGKKGDSGSKYITIKGSDTMVHLVSSWAEAFMLRSPSAEVSVTGGGSGTGIAALLNGTTDICAASREIKANERELASQKSINPVEITVARDGIAVVVHPDNPVSELTMAQMKSIFTGSSTSWADFGGSDEKIDILSRESNSGTFIFFQEMVLEKEDYTQSARLLPATSAIIQSVSSDTSTIGYVGLGYALDAKDKVKIIRVKTDESSQSVMPSEKTVRSGEYPIARPLLFYTNGDASGSVKEFIDFCLSAEGQKIVSDTGYVPLG